MARGTQKFLVASLLTGLALGFQNCADQKFSQAPQASTVTRAGEIFDPDAGGRIDQDDDVKGVITQTGGPNCHEELRTIATPIRFLSVVDISGSNVEDNGGTDPQRAVRSGSIQRFYNTYKGRANFGWGFLTFNNYSAQALVGPATSQPAFGTAVAMNQAINTFISLPDTGETPYLAALNMVRKAISDDTARPAGTKYIVVFYSDGQPSDQANVSVLKSQVEQIMSLLPGQISFNTVYYGDYDRKSANRLQQMAISGQGNFLDTNANPSGNAFTISDLVTIPGVVCSN